MRYETERREVAYFMRRLYAMGLTTTSGGNISMKVAQTEFLVTPSATDKARTRGHQLVLVSDDGSVMEGTLKPSIETMAHLLVYKVRPEVQAVVHAHPTALSAFAATGAIINTRLLSESYAILGTPAYVDYHTMGTSDLAAAISQAAISADCILMRNHGALAAGRTILEAFDRLEVFEAAAKVSMLASIGALAGLGAEISHDKLRAIDQIMGRQRN